MRFLIKIVWVVSLLSASRAFGWEAHGSLNSDRVWRDGPSDEDLWGREAVEVSLKSREPWYNLSVRGGISHSSESSLQGYLKEARADFYYGAHEVRLGYQHLTWGDLLGPSALDIVSPRDFSAPLGGLSLQEKLPAMMIIWNMKADFFSIQAVLSPRPRSMKLANSDSSTEVLDPEYGGHIGTMIFGLGIRAYTYRHQNRFPIFVLEGDQISSVFLTQQTQGITSDYAFEDLVVRFEGVRSITLDGTINEVSQKTIAVDGIIFQDDILGVQVTEAESVSQRTYWHGIFGRGKYFNNKLCPEFALYRSSSLGDSWKRLEVKSQLGNHFEGGIGIESFSYDRNSTFSWVQDRARSYLNLRVVL